MMLRTSVLAAAAAVATATVDPCDATCPAGYYGDPRGATEVACVMCPSGTSSAGGTGTVDALCTSCATGFHTNDEQNPPACTECTAANSVADQTNGECVCAEGFYGDGATCTACPGGSSSPADGAATTADCTECATGFHTNDEADPPACTECTAANSVADQTNGECVCAEGFYGDGATCTACPDGSSSPAEGATTIADCTECAVDGETHNGSTSAPACTALCTGIAANALASFDPDDVTVLQLLCEESLVFTQAQLDAEVASEVEPTDLELTHDGTAGCEDLEDGDVCVFGDTGIEFTCDASEDTLVVVGSGAAVAPVLAILLGLISM